MVTMNELQLLLGHILNNWILYLVLEPRNYKGPHSGQFGKMLLNEFSYFICISIIQIEHAIKDINKF